MYKLSMVFTYYYLGWGYIECDREGRGQDGSLKLHQPHPLTYVNHQQTHNQVGVLSI